MSVSSSSLLQALPRQCSPNCHTCTPTTALRLCWWFQKRHWISNRKAYAQQRTVAVSVATALFCVHGYRVHMDTVKIALCVHHTFWRVFVWQRKGQWNLSSLLQTGRTETTFEWTNLCKFQHNRQDVCVWCFYEHLSVCACCDEHDNSLSLSPVMETGHWLWYVCVHNISVTSAPNVVTFVFSLSCLWWQFCLNDSGEKKALQVLTTSAFLWLADHFISTKKCQVHKQATEYIGSSDRPLYWVWCFQAARMKAEQLEWATLLPLLPLTTL